MSLFEPLIDTLIDDAAMFPPAEATAADALLGHRRHRNAWYAAMIGPLVVPDTALAQIGRLAADDPVRVSVVVTGGAGGLVALARRDLPGVEVVAVETALRDLDDLAANAGRVAAAAAELPDDVTVFVELPYAPGWIGAVEEIESASLLGKIRTGGLTPDLVPSPEQLADQLSVLVESDLPFKATAGLHHAWPNTATSGHGQPLFQHGFLTLLMALDALVDGANLVEATELLRLADRNRISAGVGAWGEANQLRVRRRFRSFGCCGVTDPVADLVALGLVTEPE